MGRAHDAAKFEHSIFDTLPESPMTLPESPPLIVLGMHRSGTSLVARLLSDLGLHMGRTLDMHHESVAFKDTNRSLLSRAGAHWAKPGPFLKALAAEDFLEECHRYALAMLEESVKSHDVPEPPAQWGWKDPRNTVTLPVWRRCFPEARMLYVYRNGLDVSLSIHRRELRRWVNRSTEKRMFPPTLTAAYRLWTAYVETVHLDQMDERWLAVRYERLLEAPREEVGRIARFVGFKPDPERLQSIVRQRIARPTPRSYWDSLRLRTLARAGRIASHPLREMGYPSP